MKAYFDNAATTKVMPEVCSVMMSVMTEDYGNPSSKHTKGMDAEQYIEDARNIIANTLKCESKNIIFTSGGTEANNQALIGAAYAARRSGKHIVTTAYEHASVAEPLIFLENEGYEITYVPVTPDGHVEPAVIAEAVREDTTIVSVMLVNNEIGAINDIEAISKVIKEVNPSVLLHVDAIQAYGKLPINPKKFGADMLTASAHKLHGPKGAGFLYKADHVKLLPYIYGGGQEKGMRSGTENVPAIAGFGVAAAVMYKNMQENDLHMRHIKQIIIDGILTVEGSYINANPEKSADIGAPHIISISFEGVKSEVLLHALASEGIYVSSGSACSSNHPGLSGTLKAIGVSSKLIDSTIRISLCRDNTEEEALYLIEKIKKHVPVLRKFRSY
ncbi:MAG: cysteine desulfurase [Lachnospiraceae bacterium]|nr:cysteine desulfurase [Lachnospiraceae bacterium]